MSETLEVKIGASDAGLEATLKTVQAELARLDTKIKGGDLSFKELDQTMRKIAQTEGLEKKLQAMGTGAAGTSPKIDSLGRDLNAMGAKAEDAGEKGHIGLGKIGIAASVAGAAVKVGMKAVELATDAARAVVDQFGAAIDLGGKLNDLSSRTGETSGNLLILERAFTNTGVSADAVGTSMNKMQKFMVDAAQGGAAQSDSMARLGITMGDLEGKTPTEQMGLFAQRISSIQDPAQRAEAAMSIFGKSGGELLPILQNFSGEIEGAKGQLGGLPGVMDRSAAAFDSVGDNMAALSTKVLEFAAGFLEKALPALNAFTSALSGVDAAGWGQAAMDWVLRVADTMIGAFKNPLVYIETYINSFDVMLATVGNGLLNGAMTFIDFIVKSMSTDLPSAIGGFITTSLVDAALTFDRYLVEALMTFSAAIAEIPGFEAAGQKMLSVLSAANDEIISQQLDNMGKSKDAAAQVVTEFGKAAEKTTVFKNDFFGAEDATKRMNAGFATMEASGKETRTAMETAMVPATEGAKKVTQELKTQLDTTGLIQAAKQTELQYELDLATAKATGNQAEIKALEERKIWLDAWKKATESGMGEANANAFADAMLRAKQITDAMTGKDIILTVTTKVEDTRWKTLLAEINSETADPHSIEVALKLTGQSDLVEARKILGLMDSKTIDVGFKASGTDSLENLQKALWSMPTQKEIDLALKLTGKDNWDDAIKEVQYLSPKKEVLLELKENGFKSLLDYQNQLKQISNGARAEITAKDMGGSVAQVSAAVAALISANGKSTEVKATADTSAAKASIEELGVKPVNLTAKFDMAAFADSLQSLKAAAKAAFSEPLKLNLTDSFSTGTSNLPMPEPTKPDTSILSELKSLVSDIKELVGKIEPRLPVAALI